MSHRLPLKAGGIGVSGRGFLRIWLVGLLISPLSGGLLVMCRQAIPVEFIAI